MKFKYFVRGLGVGIIFSAVICLVAYQEPSKNAMSDDEIILRAKELGMVESQDKVGDLLADHNKEEAVSQENTTENQIAKDDTEQQIQEKKTTQSSDTTTEVTTQSTQAVKTTEKKLKDKKTTQKETTKEKKTTEAKATEEKTKEDVVKIKIEPGSSSYPVCIRLEELGMVKDAADFDTYLVDNGYANRIRVGEHSLKVGMSYYEIAEAISDPLEE